jgi:hypothetical protein
MGVGGHTHKAPLTVQTRTIRSTNHERLGALSIPNCPNTNVYNRGQDCACPDILNRSQIRAPGDAAPPRIQRFDLHFAGEN